MRFGCCVNMLVPLADGTGAEMIEQVAAAGFDYLELPVARFAVLPDTEFAALVKRLAASGLKAESCNDFFPIDFQLLGPTRDLKKILAYAQVGLERAAKLGAKIVVFGSGPARTVPDGFSKQAAFEQLVEMLQALGPVAEKNGVTIAIEALNRSECNIINGLAESRELAERVGHPAVQMLADYYHFALENEPLGELSAAGKRIRHVHISQPQGRGYPLSPDKPLADFCQTLQQIGYNERLSVEANSKNFEADASAALQWLRQIYSC